MDSTSSAPGSTSPSLAVDSGALGAATSQPGYPRQERDRTVLAEYPTGGPRRERFELSIAACQGKECPVQVRLLDDAGARGNVSLDWASASREATRAEARGLWQSGNPLDTARREAWSTGEEETEISTTARLVRLSGGTPALLVWQSGGFEHVKRRHYVVTSVDGRIERAWVGEELGGPSFSDVAVARDSAGVDRLLFFRSVTGDDEFPDYLAVAPLRWDGRRLREGADPATRLVGVVTAPFASLAAARAALGAASDCLSAFSVVPPPAGGAGFVLLAVVPSQQVAAALRDRVARCAPSRQPRVIQLNAPYASDAGR